MLFVGNCKLKAQAGLRTQNAVRDELIDSATGNSARGRNRLEKINPRFGLVLKKRIEQRYHGQVTVLH